MTWYSILHGPEIWLAIAGLCGWAMICIGVGCIIFATWPENEGEKRVKKK